MRRERHVVGVHVLRRPNHDGQVGEVVGELVQQFLTVMHREVELDVGIALGEFGEQARKKIIAPR